jgi:hypothetical protein
MPVFRTVGYAGISPSSSFFDILSVNLQELAKAGDIQMVSIARKIVGEQHQFADASDYLDQLLVREGKPLINVSINVRGSSVNSQPGFLQGYVDGPAYREQSETGVVAKHAELLSLRLKSELAPVKSRPERASQAPDRIEQMGWSIDIYYPGQESRKGFAFEGSPFDFDKLELAYTAIVDAIVLRSKPAA